MSDKEEKQVAVRYIGNKSVKHDNVCWTGTRWNGAGDVKEVAEGVADKLLTYKAVWELADGKEAQEEQETTETTDTSMLDGNAISIAKTLPGASISELEALRDAELTDKNRKGVIKAIEDEMASRREAI